MNWKQQLTVEQAEEIAQSFKTVGSMDNPYPMNCPVLVETVTKYFSGKIVRVGPQEIVLEESAWVPDTGRYMQAVQSGGFAEVEPINRPIVIGRGAIVSVVPIPTISLSQK